jgi:hypothetical protein
MGCAVSDKFIVESHTREYLLLCSEKNRAGKFKRVSQESLDEINTLVDNVIRQVESKVPEPLHACPDAPEALRLITGYALEKVRDRLEAAARKIICNKVQRLPSIGITI